MRVLFFLGWLLLFLAFAAAAAEAIPHALPGGAAGSGWFVSAYDLWYAAWPGTLVVTKIQVERLAPALWDPVILILLTPPAWLLFAVPGVLLTWFFRPHKELTAEQLEDLQKQEEALFLFDKLAEEARDAGFDNGEDDQAPDIGSPDIIDITDTDGATAPASEDSLGLDLNLDEDGGGDSISEGGEEDGGGRGGGGEPGGKD